jgi:hypothetical protein
MPRGNGMGPNGMGPMSAWAAGHCAANGMPGYVNAPLPRGRGCGNRNMFRLTGLAGWQRAAAGVGGIGLSPEQEIAFLHNQSKGLEESLQKTRERIAELEKEEGR